MAILFTNFAYSTLAFSITSGDTSLTITSGHGVRFPNPSGGDYFYLTLEDASLNREIVKVTARFTDAMTIVRAQDGTIARAFTAGASTALTITGQTLLDWGAKTPLGYSFAVPNHTTAQRETGLGFFGYNTTTGQFEGYGPAGWGSIGGGAAGAGVDAVFVENDKLITGDYTVGQAAMVSGITVTIASPAVVTQTAHGYIADQSVRFTTTGALPTGLDNVTEYFVISAGLATNTFQVSTTMGGSAVNTSGTQSGVHSCGKIKNAVSGGVVGIATGVTVTVPTGATWSIA